MRYNIRATIQRDKSWSKILRASRLESVVAAKLQKDFLLSVRVSLKYEFTLRLPFILRFEKLSTSGEFHASPSFRAQLENPDRSARAITLICGLLLGRVRCAPCLAGVLRCWCVCLVLRLRVVVTSL